MSAPFSGESRRGGTASGVFHPKGSPQLRSSLQCREDGSKKGSGVFAGEGGAPPSWCMRQCHGLLDIFLQPLNVLLIFVPVGIFAGIRPLNQLVIFTCNFLAIIPLAAVLGSATEGLAAHTGQMIGGLLNATFGNAVEMIVTITAIRSGLVPMVQQSLIGSILSNLLLVLGMAFLAGGLVTKTARFNKAGAGTNVSCLVLSSLALTLPTVFNSIPDVRQEDCVMLSRIIALVMAFVYVAFLVFQLRTHVDFFVGEEGGGEEEPELAISVSLVLLLLTTCAVAYCSEFLVHSIKFVSENYGLPSSFIGLILIPIVGNAAEHTTAVSAAYKGMMDLAIGVAVGSSTQIALFVIPFSVIVGWISDVDMTLDFEAFDATVFLLSVFIASGILGDGQANWFEGLMLCSTYAIVAIITWFIPTGAQDPGNSEARLLGMAESVELAQVQYSYGPSLFV